jgi:CTP:molybdopterin cytidylyltransferase MocA
MGQSKQLLPLDGKPFILHCIENIRDAGIADIVAVLGPDSKELPGLLYGLPVEVALNNDPGSDMAASVRAGLSAVKEDSSGVLICLCDHPLVGASTIKALAARHHEAPDRIIIPAFNNIKGHPTLFPRVLIREIYSGMNLRQIINSYPDKVELLSVEDRGVIIDIDTKEDYMRARDILRSGPPHSAN